MALDRNALQKKRAKREAKRKLARKASSGSSGVPSVSREWTRAASAPVADVLVPTNLFGVGMGTVWLSRHLPDGRYALVGILLDVWCLGVKNALYKIADSGDYPGILASIQSNPDERFERQSPAYARKLVETALAYAKDLGFEPHSDYRIARLIFGDIDPGECTEDFVMGRNGQPCYIEGPNDTLAIQRRILKQLAQHRGSDGQRFLTGMPDSFQP